MASVTKGKAREGEKEAMVRELEEFTILADEFKSDAATREKEAMMRKLQEFGIRLIDEFESNPATGKVVAMENEVMVRKVEELTMRLVNEFRSNPATASSRPTTGLRTVPVEAQHSTTQKAYVLTTQPQDGAHCQDVECILRSAAAKQELIEYPMFPQPTALLASREDDGGQGVGEASPPYRIAPIPSKGLGMIATRAIPQGSLVAGERPLLIVPKMQRIPDSTKFTSNATVRRRRLAIFNEVEKEFRVAFARMDPANQEAYMALHNAHRDDGSGPLLGIMRTNAYRVCILEGEPYSGVFKDLSRINHSCSPNTIYHFDRASLSMLFFAARDIPAGAEITSGYCDTLQPHATRAQALKPYGIRCTCAACINPTASDANRLRISHVTDAVPAIIRWAGKPALPDGLLLRPTLAMLELIKTEGLEGDPVYVRVLYHIVLVLQVLAVTGCSDSSMLLLVTKQWATLRGCFAKPDREEQTKFMAEMESVTTAALARSVVRERAVESNLQGNIQ
ncbi:hypothetical protein CCMSSC00406_0008111 [Pleurotus cornucopiae]|uniref:Uncharacterized protein n=1 Tax=Pleurotus cornucopiae TaxID=5321 RepID=A0ACB7IIX0_PLECO|nr:hypothetical protein CCMSSC00406_0008111 [Pleurotus cornucopiae]